MEKEGIDEDIPPRTPNDTRSQTNTTIHPYPYV